MNTMNNDNIPTATIVKHYPDGTSEATSIQYSFSSLPFQTICDI